MLFQKLFQPIVLGYCWLSIGDTCSVQKPFTTAHVWLCMNSCFCLVALGGPSIVYVLVILGQTRNVDVIDKLTYWKKPSSRIDRIKVQKSRKTLKSQPIFNSNNGSNFILLEKCETKKLDSYLEKGTKKGIIHAEKINEVPKSHKKLWASNMDESRAAKDLFAPIGFRCIEAWWIFGLKPMYYILLRTTWLLGTIYEFFSNFRIKP